jgi:hypothetical protein
MRRCRRRREIPSAVWWSFITLAYMFGFQEGRQQGRLEGAVQESERLLRLYKTAAGQ